MKPAVTKPSVGEPVVSKMAPKQPIAMKRSQNLKLVLMTAAVPLALAACDSEPTGQVLTSVEQCGTQTEVPADECRVAYQKALAEHEKLAPRFDNKVECDKEFTNCTAVEENGRTVHTPPMGGFLMGYLIGNALGGRGGYGVGGASPLYRDYRGGYYKPGGDYVGDRVGNVSGKRGNTALPARAMTVSRSGVGSGASSRRMSPGA